MHELDIIPTLVGGLGAALLFGYATQRLGLSPIVGYLLAGVVIGPNSPGFTADTNIANQFAEVGVVLLMFGVGLHFDLDELSRVRRIAYLELWSNVRSQFLRAFSLPGRCSGASQPP